MSDVPVMAQLMTAIKRRPWGHEQDPIRLTPAQWARCRAEMPSLDLPFDYVPTSADRMLTCPVEIVGSDAESSLFPGGHGPVHVEIHAKVGHDTYVLGAADVTEYITLRIEIGHAS